MYKIMIVEDDEIISNSIAGYLEKWQYSTCEVQNFQNVVHEFVEYSPDLVLMDINLPYFDGYYFCEEIRKISKVPIIFISSANDDMNIVMAMNIGADDYITKPFHKLELIAEYAENILVLDEGEIILSGKASEVLNNKILLEKEIGMTQYSILAYELEKARKIELEEIPITKEKTVELLKK